MAKPIIQIRMGSDSDRKQLYPAFDLLDRLEVPYEERILSAHRTPDRMMHEAVLLEERGFRACIAAAGGSAHLAGMTASETQVPVIAMPIYNETFRGLDALYSMINMPEGVPNGCVAPGQAESAAILAVQIAYQQEPSVRNKLREYRGMRALHKPQRELFVTILKPSGLEEKLDPTSKIQGMLTDFGIKHDVHQAKLTNAQGLAKDCDELANWGAKAIIAIGALDGENTTNYFPRMIADITDIPVVGLIVGKGYAGPGAVDDKDVFYHMLGRSDDENYVGSPVAGIGYNRVKNAVLFAAQICGVYSTEVRNTLKEGKVALAEENIKKDEKLIVDQRERSYKAVGRKPQTSVQR